jgi:hypothetical protein
MPAGHFAIRRMGACNGLIPLHAVTDGDPRLAIHTGTAHPAVRQNLTDYAFDERQF